MNKGYSSVSFRYMRLNCEGTNTTNLRNDVRMKFIDYLRRCVRERCRAEQVRRGVSRCDDKFWPVNCVFLID